MQEMSRRPCGWTGVNEAKVVWHVFRKVSRIRSRKVLPVRERRVGVVILKYICSFVIFMDSACLEIKECGCFVFAL